MTETGPANLATIGIHRRPDEFDPRVRVSAEHDQGLPPILRGLLTEIDPDIVQWRPVLAAEVVGRYYDPADVPVVQGEVIYDEPPPQVDHEEYGIVADPGQPAWTAEPTANDHETQVIEDVWSAGEGDRRWWPWRRR